MTRTETSAQLPVALAALRADERALATALRRLAAAHRAEAGLAHDSGVLAGLSERHDAELTPFVTRHGAPRDPDPIRLVLRGDVSDLLSPAIMLALAGRGGRARGGDAGVELRQLCVLLGRVEDGWDAVRRAARQVQDAELLDLARASTHDLTRQLRWVREQLTAPVPAH